MNEWMNRSINQSMEQSINQWSNQSSNQLTIDSTSQSNGESSKQPISQRIRTKKHTAFFWKKLFNHRLFLWIKRNKFQGKSNELTWWEVCNRHSDTALYTRPEWRAAHRSSPEKIHPVCSTMRKTSPEHREQLHLPAGIVPRRRRHGRIWHAAAPCPDTWPWNPASVPPPCPSAWSTPTNTPQTFTHYPFPQRKKANLRPNPIQHERHEKYTRMTPKKTLSFLSQYFSEKKQKTTT